MSARRVANDGHALPPNPTYIEFTRSDGTPNSWPSNITRIVDHEGFVNYHEHLPLGHAQDIRYRVQVAEIVSRLLNYPGM